MEKMASRAGRLKERGKRGKHGSPEGEGGGERHAPAKPRLVAVLRSKLRFTRFLQVPTGSHCLSPPPSPSGYWFPDSCFPGSWLLYSTFLFTCLSADGITLSFSVPLSFRLLDCLLPLSLYFPQVPTGSLYLSPSPLPFGLLD